MNPAETLERTTAAFSALPPYLPDASSGPVRVCLATPEIAGPIFTGGVGTFYASLADALVRHGHEVTIAYALGEHSERGTIRRWVEHYAQRQVRFVPVPESSVPLEAPMPRRTAYGVYRWLRDHEGEFDVVHFPEWQGVGYYALNAKRQGLAFADTTFVVVSHSPTMYLAPSHLLPVDDSYFLELDFLERGSVEAADYLVSPSAFLLRWMQSEGWNLPERTFVHPLILPPVYRTASRNGSAADGSIGERRSVREFVFFGRLDVLKGLDTFCAALDRLAESELRPVSVAFLGRESVVEGVPSRAYLERRAAAWPFEYVVHTDLDTAGALAYLRGDGRVAVTASRIENSPNTVYECLGSRVPFVVSAVGGVPELLAEADRDRVLFTPRPDELAGRLRELLATGAPVARPAIDFDDAEQRWIGLHESIVDSRELPGRNGGSPAPAGEERPLVSVCLSHYNRPLLLRQALASLRTQDYPNYEVVLVDDASTEPGALAYLERLEPEFDRNGWQIIRHEQNRYLGAARNTAARHARGELLLFMDDDDYAKPSQISTLVHVAQRTDAEIVTAANDVFAHHDPPADNEQPLARSLPLGPALSVGLYTNCFGSANALIRKHTFDQLGGFSEDWGIGFEDWELYARAAFAGHNHQVIAEPLSWYRTLETGMAATTNRTANLQRVLRAYFAHTQPELHGLLRVSQAIIANQLPGGATSATIPSLTHFDLYWNSTSWRITRPLRQYKRHRHGLPPETKPHPQTENEIDTLITQMTNSLSWKLTTPVRTLGHIKNTLFGETRS